ncbi:hypothetical protein LCGC14_0256670 [marine sediment metagenome]|uniref:Zinc-binding domain-containing protein n=1 Tax=marine sediment metagenome TaxID=412755 RepID=A0A0F9WNA3_9ZZZZ
MSVKNYNKFKSECITCKIKFDIWVSMSSFSLEQETIIKRNFYYHCPTCRVIEEFKGQ